MVWVIGSNKTFNPKFQLLRWRLLLSYLTVMLAILGTFTVGVYEFFSYSIYQQLDKRLLNLAQAAAHSLTAIKKADGDIHTKTHPHIHLDGDGDLDLPWQNLLQPPQGVEWFSPQRQLLGKAGTTIPTWPLTNNLGLSQRDGIRILTFAVYESDSNQKQSKKLEGYIRTSESTAVVEAALSQLRWGLGLGSMFAFCLTGVGGLWLTKQSLEPIEQSFGQLKQFTGDASHELRNPLTVITTSVKVMQNHPERIHPQDVKKLAAIASATHQMTRLVEDLLLLARMDATAIRTHKWIPIPLDEILEDLLELLELQAQEKGIAFKSNLLTDTLVQGDATHLTRLFANLLNNALQYTQTGGTVTVSMTSIDRSVVVTVEDTGIGIAPQHLPLVFDRFWRADQARTRREGGAGMGLAIAQALAICHKGEIKVSSQLGIGSCFRVRLPLA